MKNYLPSLPDHHSPCAASLDLSGNDKSNMVAKQTQRSYLKKTKFFFASNKESHFQKKMPDEKKTTLSDTGPSLEPTNGSISRVRVTYKSKIFLNMILF